MADFGPEFSPEFGPDFYGQEAADAAAARANAEVLVKNPRRGIRTINATAFGIRRVASPNTFRRRYRYPTSIIPPQRLNIYKEAVPDVYAPTDVYSTGSDSGPEIMAPATIVTPPVVVPPTPPGPSLGSGSPIGLLLGLTSS